MTGFIKRWFWGFLKDNNVRWYTGVVISILWFIFNVWMFDVGSGIPDPLADTGYQDIYLYGAEAFNRTAANTSIPTSAGKYFWYGWIAFSTLVFFYTFAAFSDEAKRAWESAQRRIREQKSAKQDVKNPEGATSRRGPEGKVEEFISTRARIGREFLTEFVAELATDIIRKRR